LNLDARRAERGFIYSDMKQRAESVGVERFGCLGHANRQNAYELVVAIKASQEMLLWGAMLVLYRFFPAEHNS
jgi:hypothetical protein